MASSTVRQSIVALLMLLFLAAATPATAQELTGGVGGTIADSSGAVLPGATIELTNVATGLVVTQVTSADGRFVFNAVKPGSYVLKVSLNGFKTATHEITVELNRSVEANLRLEIGDLTEEVVVVGAVSAVDTVRAQVATNVDARTITELPNINRDITDFVNLVPGGRSAQGTTVGGGQVVDLSGNYAQGNGTRRSQSVFYVDGSENMGAWRNQALQMPNPDTVQEMQIISSSASAEFGKEPGMSVNAILKSGTNDFHGTALFATHWGALNANTWSASNAGRPVPPDNQKWMGATIGGPIAKNRTFFFGSFQRFQDREAGQQSGNRMPTQAMVNGDFSAIPGFSIKLIDPTTGLAIDNKIPSYLINPISAQLKARYPTIPEYSNDPVNGRYFWRFERPSHNNEFLGKVDHKFNDRNEIAVSYMTTDGAQVRPDNVSGLTNNIPGWGGDTQTSARQNTFSVRHMWQLKSNMLVESRGAMGRLHSLRDRTGDAENLATLGGVWPEVSPGVSQTLPTVFLTNGPTARGGQFSDLVQQNFRILSAVSWFTGSHNVKFGGEYQYSNYSRFLNYDNGQFTFNGAYANTSGPLNGPWPSLSTPSGDLRFAYSWADFLLGRVNTFNATGVPNASYEGGAMFFFVQDQWQVTRRLTITPGLRYELYGTQTSSALLAGYVAGHLSNQYPTAPVGVAFNGDQGIPDGMKKPDRDNVAPRLGIAYDLTGDGRTVLRVGGGLYYAYPPLSIVEQLGSTVGAPTNTGNNSGFTDPWATARANSRDTTCQFTGCTMPSFDPDPAKRTWTPTNIIGYAPDAGTPYMWQFNAMLQRELRPGLIVEGGYVGNRAEAGFSVRDNNLAVWAPGANDGNVNARRPNQTWRQINLITNDMNESYDALQATATLRRSKVYARLTYTLQHYLTTADDQAQEVGISNSPTNWTDNPRDLPGEIASVVPRQQIRGFGTYQLPRISGNSVLDGIFGGWQISGNFTWYDGDQLNVTLGRENNFDGFAGDRPDQVGDIKYIRTTQNGVATWIDRSAFTDPPPATATNQYPFGTLPRNAVRGPSRLFMDAALLKDFPIKNEWRFQFRIDASNLLNHPYLSNPEVNLSSSDFGLIRTKDGGGRVFQLQFKLIF